MAVYKEKEYLKDIGLPNDINIFENVKPHIYMRLFNKENLPFNCNISNIPYKRFLDCAITYCVQVKTYINQEKGVACYLIKNTDVEKWGIEVDELHSVAYNNTRQSNNARIETLQKHITRYHILSPINEISNDVGFTCDVSPSTPKNKHERHTLFEAGQYGQMPVHSNINLARFIQDNKSENESENLLIISNRTLNFGAVNMVFKDVTDKVYDIFQEDFYMLPLSIHEILCVRKSFANRDSDNTREAEEELLDMVEQINDQILSKTFDILSYNIYLHLHDDNCTFMIK